MNFVVISLSWAGWIWTGIFFIVVLLVLARRREENRPGFDVVTADAGDDPANDRPHGKDERNN
ncbi:MAG: hypothetical protein AAGK78_12110 [Planctomycetota bacterium]